MRKLFLALIALFGLMGAVAFGNYTATQGTGTTFGSVVVGGFHYVQFFLCDLTTPGQCAAVSAAGAVKVDGSAVTQPISGTVTANAGTNLNTSALSTSALQPTNAAQGSTTAAQTGTLVQCAVTTAAPSYTTAQTDPFSCDPTGNLRVTATGQAIGSTTSGQIGSLVMGAATTYAPTTTTADTWPLSMDAVGNLRTVSQASGSKITGTASSAATTTTSLIGAVASERIYVQAYSCSNSGATATVVSFQDGSGGTTLWTAEVPAGGGHNLASSAPMFWTTAGNALFFASGSASTTVFCNAAGYAGN
jgi:hypothetical protein